MQSPREGFPKANRELADPRPAERGHGTGLRPELSLPSRIAVIGNHLPRQCGIATFTTDLCDAIATEYGNARLLALPVNDYAPGI